MATAKKQVNLNSNISKTQETQLSGELFSSFATNSLTQNLKHLHDRNR